RRTLDKRCHPPKAFGHEVVIFDNDSFGATSLKLLDQRREPVVSQEFDHDETAIRSGNRELAERAIPTAMAGYGGHFCSPSFIRLVRPRHRNGARALRSGSCVQIQFFGFSERA